MEYSIDLVHTADDDHLVTAFRPDGTARMSMNRDGEISEPGTGGERLEQLAKYDDEGDTWTLRSAVESLRRQLDLI